MSDAKPGQEPTMEEILASIRQIISDDPGSARKAGGVPDDGGDVLELTEVMNEDGSVTPLVVTPATRRQSDAPALAPEAARARIAGAFAGSATGKAPTDEGVDAEKTSSATVGSWGMVSDSAAGNVAASLDGLADAVSGSRHVQIGGGGKTLETLIKEMLRPMLKDWLDENLPALVERLVEREIHRISGRADGE
jgi:uncharacterized protein